MSNRKLQTEIERTLKKVTEGLEIFHETLEKLESATSGALKEKMEVELKKEIKKLQRLRDLIKGWQQLAEIKDKQPINDARRLIELEMERFKVLEKEMKIKAFSKEGLSQAAKLDPREQEKLRVAHWINSAVDKLSTQKDALEAELETLQIASRKTKRSDPRLEVLPEMVERHKGHIRKLEQVLRLMENDVLSVEGVNGIKDDVEYYVEANQDPDFVPDEDLYEQFELSDEVTTDDDNEYSDEGEEGEDSLKGSSSSVLMDSPPSLKKKPSLTNTNSTIAANASPPGSIIKSASATTTTSTSTSSPLRKKEKVVIIKTSQSAAAASSHGGGGGGGGGGSVQIPVVLPPVPPSLSMNPMVVPVTAPKVSGPSFASAIAAAGNTTNVSSTLNIVSPPSTTTTTNFTSNATLSFAQKVAAGNNMTSTAKPLLPSPNTSSTSPSSVVTPGPYDELFAVIQRRRAENSNSNSNKPFVDFLAMLDSSYSHCPDGSEMERSRVFTPKQPYTSPSYYSTHPPAILENPAIFERFELDTLFFIFYYQQKTYPQYLAARELKRQSWRFHKKYLTWFQRHEEPKTITEDYEHGTYIYFDYEGNWCQRKKSEFTFEYRYLEDEETV